MMAVTVTDTDEVIVTYKDSAWIVTSHGPEDGWEQDHVRLSGYGWEFSPADVIRQSDRRPRYEEHEDGYGTNACALRGPPDLLKFMEWAMGPRAARAAFAKLSFGHIACWGCNWDGPDHDIIRGIVLEGRRPRT